MKPEDYINAVVSQIKDTAAKNSVKKELEAHIADRTEYYENAGYNHEEAVERAMANMGGAENVAQDMSRLYPSAHNTAAFIFVFAIYLAMGFFGFWADLFLSSSLSFGSLMIEGIIILMGAAVVFISHKLKNQWLCLIPAFHAAAKLFFVSTALDFEFASPFVYFLNCLFYGQLENFNEILSLYTELKISPALKTESYIFYGILIAALFANFYAIALSKYKFKDKPLRILKIFNFAVAACFAVFLLVNLASDEAVKNTADSYAYDYVYIYESDSKCNPEELGDDCITVLQTNYDFTPYPYLESRTENEPRIADTEPDEYGYTYDDFTNEYKDIKYDRFLSIVINTTYFKYETDKKYIMLVPVYDDDFRNDIENGIDYSQYEWIEAEGFECESPLHDNCFPVNYYHITVVKK
ncbi:MAG: permease prefix domain 1-containing protein [Eubacterium sp.]